MSVSSTTNRVTYTGNAAAHVYAYTFRITDQSHLEVTVKDTASPPVETTLTLTTDYTVSGVNSGSGGNVTLVNASQSWLTSGELKSGYTLVIRRVLPLTQPTDIRNQGSFLPETHENAFDRGIMIAQQQEDELDRSVKLPETVTSSAFDPTLPTDIATVSSALVTNATGDGWDVGPTTSEISNAQTYATNASTSATAAATSATAAATSATAAATSATAAATSASAASTSATNAATSATNASNSASAAATSATNAATSETNSASSASAASTSATNAAASATSASGSATTATTQASNASTSATNAAASATAAATSETNAAASAASALAAASAIPLRDVLFKTSADSPITIDSTYRGKLVSIDATSGAVTVNLPSIAGLDLTSAYAVAIKKSDSSANAITINRNGTDTIDGSASKTISLQNAAAILVPDTDSAPDKWTALDSGVPVAGSVSGTTLATSAADGSTLEVASGSMRMKDGGTTTAKLDTGVVNGLTTVTLASGDYVAIADVSDSSKAKKALVSDIGAAVVPAASTYTPTWTGYTASPSATAYYWQIGKMVTLIVPSGMSGTSNSTSLAMTLPVAAKNAIDIVICGDEVDNGSRAGCTGSALVRTTASSTTLQIFKDWQGNSWTAANAKAFQSFIYVYEAA